MLDTLMFGIPASVIVITLVGITRPFVKDSRWYPWISVLYGIVIMWISIGFALTGIFNTILGGIVLGLVSAGLFDTGKSGIKIGKEIINK